MLNRACYDSLWRGHARTLQIQRQMLEANHWTERRVPNGGVGGWTGGVEVAVPMRKMKMSANQTSQGSQRLSHLQRLHIVPDKSIADDSLVRHHWEESSLVL